MSSEPDTTSLSDSELADLSSLADGSIDPARRPAVEARIAQSAELTALYERERNVVELLHRAAATDRAPASLRARLEAQRPSAGCARGAASATRARLPAGSRRSRSRSS